MTTTRIGAGLASLVGAAVLVAACGSSGPSAAPTQAATQPAATEPGASVVLPTFDIPGFSFALPSFSSDKELEAMFPAEVAGQALTVQSMSGTDFMAFGGASTMGPALEHLGKTPDDMSVAFGGTTDGSVVIFAFRIKGVNAGQFLDAFTATAPSGAAIHDGTFGGKSVKQVTTAGSDTVYLYLHDDVIWTVGGKGLTDPILDEAFSKLP